jgi:hypothetical protein
MRDIRETTGAEKLEHPVAVFLLGAAILSSMPVMTSLADTVFRHPQLSGRGETAEDSFGLDLELWLSYLASDHPWLPAAANLRNQADYLYAATVLTEVLLNCQEETLLRPSPSCPSWLIQFVSAWHNARTTVITLNYDTLVEKAYVEQAAAPYPPTTLASPSTVRAPCVS